MSAGGSISAMIASMKNNSRRKNKHVPFSANSNNYKKGKALSSRQLTEEERDAILTQLRSDRETEKKKNVYKLITSLILTILVISGLSLLIKLIFF